MRVLSVIFEEFVSPHANLGQRLGPIFSFSIITGFSISRDLGLFFPNKGAQEFFSPLVGVKDPKGHQKTRSNCIPSRGFSRNPTAQTPWEKERGEMKNTRNESFDNPTSWGKNFGVIFCAKKYEQEGN